MQHQAHGLTVIWAPQVTLGAFPRVRDKWLDNVGDGVLRHAGIPCGLRILNLASAHALIKDGQTPAASAAQHTIFENVEPFGCGLGGRGRVFLPNDSVAQHAMAC